MMKSQTLLCIALLSAGTAFAHSGVKNAVVKARMDVMSGIAAEMKVLGQMAKGVTLFDKNAARAAAAAIAKHAAETPALFEAEEDDPKSEAKAEIWTNFTDFTQKSQELENIALGLSISIANESDLAEAMKALGANCQSCHKSYRE